MVAIETQFANSSGTLVGRPSIDPELMIRMLLVGYCYGIRSERQTGDFIDSIGH
jgi:transposase